MHVFPCFVLTLCALVFVFISDLQTHTVFFRVKFNLRRCLKISGVALPRMLFGGGVADKDLTFNQKFLRLSGPVEELVEVGVFVGPGAIWSDLVTCKNLRAKKITPRFPSTFLVHTWMFPKIVVPPNHPF